MTCLKKIKSSPDKKSDYFKSFAIQTLLPSKTHLLTEKSNSTSWWCIAKEETSTQKSKMLKALIFPKLKLWSGLLRCFLHYSICIKGVFCTEISKLKIFSLRMVESGLVILESPRYLTIQKILPIHASEPLTTWVLNCLKTSLIVMNLMFGLSDAYCMKCAIWGMLLRLRVWMDLLWRFWEGHTLPSFQAIQSS